VSPRDAASHNATEPLIGRTLGDFVVRAHLATGAHGDVYLAEQPGLGREAVIKIARGASDERTQRFLREVRLAARLDHPYAAHVYAFGAEPDGLLWVAMERVHGATLAELIAEQGTLALDRLVPLLERICEVVHTAHEQGIVHRDLKPANVMVVARAGRLLPKLLDLGIARAVAGRDEDAAAGGAEPAAAGDATLTRHGDIVGSPAFMAPEQWFDPAGVDRRTDIYALGALMYVALTGALPFQGATPRDVARAHAQQPPPSLGPRFPAALDAAVARALAKHREQRFATALELAAAVRAAATGDAPPGLPALAPAVRDAMLGGAPAPVADALAAYEAARDATAGLAALELLVTAIVRWLAVLALAGRARHGEWSAEARALLLRLRSGPLSNASWLALARAAIGTASAALLPVPELANVLADASLAAVTEPAPMVTLPARLASVERMLRAIGFVIDLPVVIRRADQIERWTGTRRRRRPILRLADPSTLPIDAPVLLDADGAPLLVLAPFAVLAQPTLGADAELFLLDRGAPGGAVYLTFPERFEHRDDPWAALGAALPAPDDDGASAGAHGPYRGLEPFRTDDAAWFFGRDAAADAAANRLRDRGVLAVVGPSGAGKSSFVLAGVVPRLSGHRTVVLRPGPRPELALDIAHTAGTLVVVDQLEELVTLAVDAEARARFAERLVALVAAGARLAVTVRDDFLLRVAAIGGLRALLEPAVQLLATPSRDQLHRIVVEPARRAGYVFDDEHLADAMVDAVADHPGALPLLSFTAARLWRERDRHLRQLTRRAYDAIGGVAGALAGHADAVVDELGPARLATVRDVFRNLATAEGTRAALTRAELDQVVGAGAAAVVTRLVDARLLVTTEDAAGDRVELVHEALLDAWPRLRRWRQDDAEVARLRDQLRAAARQWDERARPRGLLWRGDALDEYRLWRPRYGGALTGREEAFAGASLADAARGRRHRRWLYGGALGVLAVAAVALLAIATEARRSRVTAETSRKLAEVSRRAAEERTTQLFVEHGRRALLDDDGQRAYIYLGEATRRGAADVGMAMMLARAGRLMLTEQVAVQGASPIYAAAWRPDGTGFATAGADGVVELWSRDGTRRARLHGHTGVVWSLAWSPDGQRLVSAGDDTVPRLWDAEHGALIATLRGHRAGSTRTSRGNHGLAVSRDGRWIASSSWGGDVWLWDAVTGAPRAQLDGHDGAVNAVAFAADSATLLTTDQTSVRIWELGPHPRQRAVIREPTGAVRWLGLAAGGWVVATAKAGPVRVIDPQAARIVRTLAIDEGGRPPLVDGDQVITIGAGGQLRAWQLDGTRQWETAPGVAVSSLALGRDRVVAGDNAGQLRIWDRASGRAAISHADFHQKVWATAVSPDGATVLASDLGGAIRRYATSGVDEVSRDRVTALAVGFAADHLISVGAGGIRRGRAASTALRDVRDGALTADGRALIVTGDGRVRLYEREGTDRGGPEEMAVPPIAISANGDRAATARADGGVTLWQVAGWHRLATLRGRTARLTALSFDHAATRLVTCSDDRTAQVWGASDGALITTLVGHDSRVVSARFVGDTRLITASSDRTWRRWELPSGRMLNTYRNVGGEVLAVDVARDGRVATGGEGGVVVWSAEGVVLARFLPEAQVQSLAWNADGTRLAAATGTGTADDGDVVVLDVAIAPADAAAVDCRITMMLGADERLIDRASRPACPRVPD
jgi:WD40 repeat protein